MRGLGGAHYPQPNNVPIIHSLSRIVRRVLGRTRRLAPVDAYRLWAGSYDAQPDNLVLSLEDELFRSLLGRLSLTGARVLDIGCGTGRHWQALLAQKPSSLIGVDVSREMLDRLRDKFPDATLHHVVDDRLPFIDDHSVDVIISTLTIGHIADLSAAITEWRRVLRPGGTMLITDFHPEGFRRGMTRSFRDGATKIEVENHY